jgi:replicative DNA helicase
MDTRPLANEEAEQALLGCCLLDAKIVAKVAAQIEPVMFYLSKHVAIYQVILDLDTDTDLVTVTDRLRQAGKSEDAGGISYIASLPNFAPAAGNWDHYAGIIRRAYAQRMIELLGHDATKFASSDPEEALAKIEHGAREIRRALSLPSRVARLEDVLPDLYEDIQRDADLPAGEVPGVPTGFARIDEATGGQQPGELIIVSARTGHGKSALAGHLWDTAARRRGPALLCSNEMTVRQYAQRVWVREAEVNLTHLRNPRLLNPTEEHKLSKAMGVLCDIRGRFYLAANVFTVERMRAALEEVHDQQDRIVWACIDWIQLLRGPRRSDGRVAEIDGIVRDLQEMAGEYGIPIVMVSQYDKWSSQHGAIGPEAARNSATPGQAAAMAIDIVFNDEDEWRLERQATLKITKARNGAQIEEPVLFRKPFMQFVPLDRQRKSGESARVGSAVVP